MKLAILGLALVIGACSGAAEPGDVVPPYGGDAASPPPPTPPPPGGADCALDLRFDPSLPVADASTTIRVSVVSPASAGITDYLWSVSLDASVVDFVYPGPDHGAIEFPATRPGAYHLSVQVVLGAVTCAISTRTINVRPAGARLGHLRLRVLPPAGVAAPPLEQPLTVEAGTSADLGVVVVDRGIPVAVQVVGASGGVPAYVRFSPMGARNAVVEAFSDSAGGVATSLVDDFYTVLVVPAGATGVPHRFPSWAASQPTSLSVASGDAITGSVTDPAGAALAGAIVQLAIDGVPSTVATTTAAGGFALQAAPGTGAVEVTVTPPMASGLPRLAVTSTALDLAKPLQIRYAANLARRSLAGLAVRRGGAGLARAQLTIVGALAAVGTVTAGASVTATGEVRIPVTADAAGNLPAQLVPAARLVAVVSAVPGDLAVAALDTTMAVPATLDAPAMQVVASAARGPDGGALAGAVIDLVPIGALAMAAAPPLHVTADRNGAFSAALAAGGHYDLRLIDPAGRAAPLVVADRIATTITGDGYGLPAAIAIRGALLLGGKQPLPGASVQILCGACTGVDRAKPIAEVLSDDDGRFALAVPDPGTM
jgi:hypothetical protein